jgi:SAM-dependent methyltransferase
MGKIDENKDATGHAVYDAFNRKYGFEVVEREDGYIVGGNTSQYFEEYSKWLPHEKKAIRYAKGKILDIGCGAGKHSLYLQSIGFDVLGIDISPLLIKVCKKRGLRKVRLLSIWEVNKLNQYFDTILLLGCNFGLLQNFSKARNYLKLLYKVSKNKAVIIAESMDPYKTEQEANLKYQKYNLKRGRMAGHRKIRIRYRNFVSDWFDYLGVSKKEMENVVKDTGWKIKKTFDSERSSYIAVIEKIE